MLMPFYEYECQSCKFYVELLQKVSDAPLKKCPSCGKNTVKKLVSAPVFRLKGGGWYETDFKGDKENKRNLAIDKEPETSSSGDDKAPKAPPVSDAKGESKAAESKPAEKGSGSSGSEAKSSGSRKTAGSSSAAAAKGRAGSSRGASKPSSRPAAKSKAKPAARRKSR
jgi:putative FmdB family regulatory protein